MKQQYVGRDTSKETSDKKSQMENNCSENCSVNIAENVSGSNPGGDYFYLSQDSTDNSPILQSIDLLVFSAY